MRVRPNLVMPDAVSRTQKIRIRKEIDPNGIARTILSAQRHFGLDADGGWRTEYYVIGRPYGKRHRQRICGIGS